MPDRLQGFPIDSSHDWDRDFRYNEKDFTSDALANPYGIPIRNATIWNNGEEINLRANPLSILFLENTYENVAIGNHLSLNED